MSSCPVLNVWNFPTLLYILVHSNTDVGLFYYTFCGIFLHDTQSAKVMQLNILCSTQYISHKQCASTVYNSQTMKQTISHTDNRKGMWNMTFQQACIVFFSSQVHNWQYCAHVHTHTHTQTHHTHPYTMGTASFPETSGYGIVSTAHPHLASRLKKEQSYTSIPTLCLHGRLWG